MNMEKSELQELRTKYLSYLIPEQYFDIGDRPKPLTLPVKGSQIKIKVIQRREGVFISIWQSKKKKD